MNSGPRVQATTSAGRGGRESLPLAIHRAWLEEGRPASLLAGRDTPLAENNASIVTPVRRGHVGFARDVRRHVRSLSVGPLGQDAPVVISHFTHDLPALRLALRGMNQVPLMVVKHVSPGGPKKDLIHRWAYSRVKRLLAVSEYVAAKCARVYPIPAARISVWHPGIDVGRFAFNPHARERIRSEHGAAAGDHVIGYVGRVTPRKGLEDLLEVFKALRVDRQRLWLWVIGGASDDERGFEARLHQFVVTHGLEACVRFCGHQSRIEDFMSAIDTFVTPSREEAFGLTTLEAMAASRPIVGFRAGGTAEIVVDGHTGILVDASGDAVRNLLEGIRALIDNPRCATGFGEAGCRRVSERFSIPAMIARLEREINACQ